VPVCYEGPHAPDLQAVAEWSGCSGSDVIARHSAPLYRVFMIGFLPGFAYLGSVDPTIAAPRRETPRLHVVAGSVGIAGLQTGIYPAESPGGWQIIGRTPLVMFDATREPPVLMQAGDYVRFAPIDIAEFDRHAARREAAR
jgi:KipI family sensor histidine kinase inhibitor